MKVKLFLLFALSSLYINAQTKEEKCNEDLQYLVQLSKTKEYDAAYPYLQSLRKECPSLHYVMYQYGELILESKIERAANPEDKEKQINDLLALFDEYDKQFPENGKGNTMKKGMLLFDHHPEQKDVVYGLLDKAFKTDLIHFTSAKALYSYFELFVNDYEAGNKGIELQQVFDKYDEIGEKLEVEEKELSDALDVLLNKEENKEELSSKEVKAKNRYEYNLEQFATVKGSMDAKIVLLSTCEKLIPFYQKSFEEKKNDATWLKRAADRLEAKNCDSDPLFTKISEQLHKLNPTAESAYLLGVAAQRAGNTSKALEFFNQSAELFTDATKKSRVYYKIATMYSNSNRTQARNYARKALAVKPSFGAAYMLIAQLYANSTKDCGNTPFEKRAIYWLCAQYANKAGAVDPALKGTAAKQAASYSASAPAKADIFTEAMAGKKICYDCWISECVTVPNL